MGAGLRSALIPGWGQLSTGRNRAGKVLVFGTGLLLILGLTLFLFVEPIEFAAWIIDPDVIFWLIVANFAILAIRLASTEHAWRAGGGGSLIAALVLGIIVAVPHIAVAWVGLETRSGITTVFAGSDAEVTAPSTTTTSAPTTTTTSIDIDPRLVAVTPGQTGDDNLPTETAPPWEPFGKDRLNVLLLGSDAGPGRSGVRTDTMIIASIDPTTGDAALIGLPRNFGKITLKDGTAVPVTQLGHVYGWGVDHPDRFPGLDPGAEAVTDAIENLTGLEIDHYAMVDLTGFADVVDVFGGVDVDVPAPVDGPLFDEQTGAYEMVTIPAGPQHLDGAHALAYARARYGSSDYARMARQRCILANIAASADMLELFSKIGAIMDVLGANVVTDMSPDQIPDLIRLSPRIDESRTRTIGLDSTWRVGWTTEARPIPDIVRIREAVASVIAGEGDIEDIGVATTEVGC